MTLTLDILHNVSSDPMRFLDGYKPDDPLVKVFTLTIPDSIAAEGIHRAMSWAFLVLNVGDEPGIKIEDEGREQAIAYRQRRNRSLSVGDVIMVDGAGYKCATIGWEYVTIHPHQIVRDYVSHGTTSIDRAVSW